MHQTQLINDDKMVISSHDRLLRELQEKIQHMPQKVDFLNFKHDFEKVRDEFIYLKADYEYKLDSNGVGMIESPTQSQFINTMKTELLSKKSKASSSLNVF